MHNIKNGYSINALHSAVYCNVADVYISCYKSHLLRLACVIVLFRFLVSVPFDKE